MNSRKKTLEMYMVDVRDSRETIKDLFEKNKIHKVLKQVNVTLRLLKKLHEQAVSENDILAAEEIHTIEADIKQMAKGSWK